MFFKKKKVMNDNELNKNKNENSNTDNMAHETPNEDVLTNMNINEDSQENMGALVEPNDEKEQKLKAELTEQKEKYLRLVAEFDNYKRRTAKENLELKLTANKEVIQSLLEVLDDMDRASKQLETAKDINLIREGVTLVFDKMRRIMQQKGLRRMETGKEEFNPDLHEAITEIAVATDDLAGKIFDVIDPGYYLNDKLIRYAKVIVGKVRL